jgi:hypothetical protein
MATLPLFQGVVHPSVKSSKANRNMFFILFSIIFGNDFGFLIVAVQVAQNDYKYEHRQKYG